MINYLDKEKIIEAFGTTHPVSIYNSIIRGEFDIPNGYILVSIEDYNNKTKLLKEKDAEISYLNELLHDEYIGRRILNRKPLFINGQLMGRW